MTDNGSCYVSRRFASACKRLGLRHLAHLSSRIVRHGHSRTGTDDSSDAHSGIAPPPRCPEREGRRLQKEQAMRVFQFNAKRFPNQWPVHVGLMRGYAAMGDKKKALEEAKLALAQAPDEGNRKNLQGLVKQLEEGKDIN